jgi:bile acid:Na+ symporter, BASS family
LLAGVTTFNIILAVIQVCASVSVFAYVFWIGLNTRPSELEYLTTRWGLMLKSLISVDVLVPLIVIAVVALVNPARATAIGLLLLAASPAAPLVLKTIARAGSGLAYAKSLHLILAALAIITTPVTAFLLSGAFGLNLGVSPVDVAESVGLSIFLPAMAGMSIGEVFPALARRIARPVKLLADIFLILLYVLVPLFTYNLILAIDVRSYFAMAAMVAGALAAGHLMAWGRPKEQTTLAIESAARNTGLAIVMASDFAPWQRPCPS